VAYKGEWSRLGERKKVGNQIKVQKIKRDLVQGRNAKKRAIKRTDLGVFMGNTGSGKIRKGGGEGNQPKGRGGGVKRVGDYGPENGICSPGRTAPRMVRNAEQAHMPQKLLGKERERAKRKVCGSTGITQCPHLAGRTERGTCEEGYLHAVKKGVGLGEGGSSR